MDGSPSIGGEGKGVRPMEMVLMACAGCSSIDIVMILDKMRQKLDNLDVIVEGSREEGAVPAVFTKIHCSSHYVFSLIKLLLLCLFLICDHYYYLYRQSTSKICLVTTCSPFQSRHQKMHMD